MYDNPTHIRDNAIKSRYSDEENELLRAVAQFNGLQVATLQRQLTLDALARWEKSSHVSDVA